MKIKLQDQLKVQRKKKQEEEESNKKLEMVKFFIYIPIAVNAMEWREKYRIQLGNATQGGKFRK